MNWIYLMPAMLLVGLAGCKKNKEIVTYTVDKEQPKQVLQPSNPHAGAMPEIPLNDTDDGKAAADPHSGMAVLAAPSISDTPAAHWKKGKTNAMRMASYQVETDDGAMVDISFTSLRSAPGGMLNNFNRWRSQVGQGAFDEEEMQKTCITVSTHFGDALVMDVEGLMEKVDPKKDGRIIGAIAEQNGRAWFFKLRGNAEMVGREKEAFLKWVGSVKPSEPVPEVPAVPAVVASSELEWTLPAGWSVNYGGQSRYATIAVPGDEPTELVISFFPGDVGGDVANVNRWRGQIGLAPLEESKVLQMIGTLEAGEKSVSLVDLKGPQKRMLAGWVRHGENTWFFKWTGSDAALDAEVMNSFIRSVRFNSPES